MIYHLSLTFIENFNIQEISDHGLLQSVAILYISDGFVDKGNLIFYV